MEEGSPSTTQQANGHIPNGSVIPSNTNVAKNQPNGYTNGHIPNGIVSNDTELQDLEDEPIQTISQKVSNGISHTIANGVQKIVNGYANRGTVANGHVANGHVPMYSEHI